MIRVRPVYSRGEPLYGQVIAFEAPLYSIVLSDGRLIRGRPALLEKWMTAWDKRNETKHPIPTVAADAFDKTVYNDKYSNITNRHEGTVPIEKWGRERSFIIKRTLCYRIIGVAYFITRREIFYKVAAELDDCKMHAHCRRFYKIAAALYSIDG